MHNHKKGLINNFRDILLFLFLVGATLGVYWQVQHYDFVSCDDPIYVTGNPSGSIGYRFIVQGDDL